MDRSITDCLKRWKSGDRAVEEELVCLLYPRLREVAGLQLARFPGAHTLQATELVHEAFERLQRQQAVDWRDRSHFLAIAAITVRRFLVDHLRQKGSLKRGGDLVLQPLDTSVGEQVSAPSAEIDWIEVDEALSDLRALDEASASVVELRVFGGLTVEEAAEVMGVSTATVGRQWRFGRAWLADRLEP